MAKIDYIAIIEVFVDDIEVGSIQRLQDDNYGYFEGEAISKNLKWSRGSIEELKKAIEESKE